MDTVNATSGVEPSWKHLRSCQLDGIKVSETIVFAGSELCDHLHETGQICFLLEGDMRERASGWDVCQRPGALRSLAPGFRHTVIASSESDVLALFLFIDADRWIPVTSTRPTVAGTQLRHYTNQIRREFDQLDDAGRAALEGWAMLALSAAARTKDVPTATSPMWLNDAVSMIERRACESISLSTLAQALGIHRTTLAAAFRRYRHTSVGESIREARVRHVMCALVSGKTPLCEIATVCGFHDQAHMGRVFRKAVGFSPGAYRRLRS
jgi:AraC family transcriptional regulator